MLTKVRLVFPYWSFVLPNKQTYCRLLACGQKAQHWQGNDIGKIIFIFKRGRIVLWIVSLLSGQHSLGLSTPSDTNLTAYEIRTKSFNSMFCCPRPLSKTLSCRIPFASVEEISLRVTSDTHEITGLGLKKQTKKKSQ